MFLLLSCFILTACVEGREHNQQKQKTNMLVDTHCAFVQS